MHSQLPRFLVVPWTFPWQGHKIVFVLLSGSSSFVEFIGFAKLSRIKNGARTSNSRPSLAYNRNAFLPVMRCGMVLMPLTHSMHIPIDRYTYKTTYIYSLRLILPVSTQILHTASAPPTRTKPNTAIAISPTSSISVCTVSVHTTAFIPPYSTPSAIKCSTSHITWPVSNYTTIMLLSGWDCHFRPN